MKSTVDRWVRGWFCIGAALALGAVGPGVAHAAKGGFYVGAGAEVEALGVLYEKVVENPDPSNVALNAGRLLQSDVSALSAAYGIGFVGGYKMPLGPSGLYVSFEGDMARHGGSILGSLLGSGSLDGLNQVGQIWPEDFTFKMDRSTGLTVRVGSGVPILGFRSGTSLYALIGLRRIRAAFTSMYSGCFDPVPCTDASEQMEGSDSFDESFTGWVGGGGIEKRMGRIAVRGEVRFTDSGSAGRTVRFDGLGVNIPISLDPKGLGVRANLLWYF